MFKLTAATIALFLSVAYYAGAQVKVDTRREFTIASVPIPTGNPNARVYGAVTGTDTAYYFEFRNLEYSTILDYDLTRLTRDGLKDIADAILELDKDQYKAKESTVTVGDMIIGKESMMGGVYFSFYHNKKLGNSMNRKKGLRMARDIYAFLGLPDAK